MLSKHSSKKSLPLFSSPSRKTNYIFWKKRINKHLCIFGLAYLNIHVKRYENLPSNLKSIAIEYFEVTEDQSVLGGGDL